MPTPSPLMSLGLSHRPFDPDGPVRGFTRTPQVELFCQRVMALSHRGGFALLTGAPGTGKSVALRLLADDLRRSNAEVNIAIMERPQASLADFYRELGHCYGIRLTPHNRWAGATALRTAWRAAAEAARWRAIVLIDEAQEMQTCVLNEARLLNGEPLDAGWLLTVVLVGDDRLLERLRGAELAPLASRIRVRLRLEEQTDACLIAAVQRLAEAAGNPGLFATGVIETLVEQAAGNFRTLMQLADQVLNHALETGAASIDQRLLLAAAQVDTTAQPASRRPAQRRAT